MVSRDRVVAVTGATGRQGGAVARYLLSDQWRVRAVTRRPDGPAARALAALGAEVVRADMMSRHELEHAFREVYGVYSVQNFMPGGTEAKITQGRNVAQAAKATTWPTCAHRPDERMPGRRILIRYGAVDGKDQWLQPVFSVTVRRVRVR